MGPVSQAGVVNSLGLPVLTSGPPPPPPYALTTHPLYPMICILAFRAVHATYMSGTLFSKVQELYLYFNNMFVFHVYLDRSNLTKLVLYVDTCQQFGVY